MLSEQQVLGVFSGAEHANVFVRGRNTGLVADNRTTTIRAQVIKDFQPVDVTAATCQLDGDKPSG